MRDKKYFIERVEAINNNIVKSDIIRNVEAIRDKIYEDDKAFIQAFNDGCIGMNVFEEVAILSEQTSNLCGLYELLEKLSDEMEEHLIGKEVL